MKKEPDFIHEVPLGGFDVRHGNRYSDSANVTWLGVSRIDGCGALGDELYSSSVHVDRIDSQVENTRHSRSIPSKRKSSCSKRQRKEKKERFIWTPVNHQLFLESCNRFSENKCVPKNILKDLEKKIPNIDREIVASHLQKHRLNIKRKENKGRNSANPSSKSVPPKVDKQENNVHQFYNDTFNYPNNGAEIIPQTHFNSSTNPNSQNYFFSNCPISQIQSLSLNPPFHTSFIPEAGHSFNNSPIPNFQFPQNETIPHFEQPHLSNPNMVHSQSSTFGVRLNHDLSMHEDLLIYSNRANNNFERRENYPLGVLRQSSNVANISNFPTPTNRQLISNIDGYDNNAFNPFMDNPNFGGFNYGYDYPLRDIQNFTNHEDINNVYPPIGNPQANYSGRGSQSNLYPHVDNQVDNNSRLPQNFGSRHIR